MDLKMRKVSPVRTDRSSSPISKSILGQHSSLMLYTQTGTSFSSTILTVPRKRPIKLDDVHSNSCLDAMKSSSPSHKKLQMNPFAEVSLDDNDCAYQSWQLRFPSALFCFEKIIEYARGKKIVMFLDYDGTLSPIVDDPDCAFISTDMRSVLKNVAKHFPTAIISGRRRHMVSELIGLTELYYAGSHGMDIKFPCKDAAAIFDHLNSDEPADHQDKEPDHFQPAMEFLPMISEVFRTLVHTTSDINGAKVENHIFCASVHYRNVDEKSWPTIAQHVDDVLQDYPRLRLSHGRKVLEVRPVIDWNKGKAVEFFLKSMTNLGNNEDVFPIYIGDDKTDEDAFKVLRQGHRGYGILVSSTPKESEAFFSLKDPEEVKEFLKCLVRWKEKSI